MATIRPFRGIRYNHNVVPDLSKVVTQPHDRISAVLQDRYYAMSPYNVVRILKRKASVDGGEEIYRGARETFQAWLRDGVLLREPAPALYVLQQTFTLPDGSTRTRLGLTAALKLCQFDEGVVLPHERTLSHSMSDRLRLLQATAANFGCVFMLYPGGGINELLEPALARQQGSALRELYEQEVQQRFFVLTDPQLVAAVLEEMAPRSNLIIADGHHRYETALAYREQMRARYPDAPPDAAFNYRLVTLVSMDDPGLVILPTHRLIHSYDRLGGAEVLERARRFFEVTPVAGRAGIEEAMAAAEPSCPCFGFHDGTSAVLTLRDEAVMERLLPDHCPAWRNLNVAVVHELFLEQILGIDKRAVERQKHVTFLRDAQEGYEAVDRGEASFFVAMKPTRIEQVRTCSAAGERMPQKSTDFYPKMISGLVALSVGAGERL